jgi:valyl-tRNA synthetase
MSRFVWSNLEGYVPRAEPDPARLTLPDRWILSRLTGLIGNAQRLFDSCQYGEAGRQMLDFLWNEFADWYVEISKSALYSKNPESHAHALDVLCYVLNASLRLLHPYIPFITEEIWGYLPTGGGPLITAAWPAANPAHQDESAEAEFAILMDLVRGIRNTRAEYKVEPARRISALIDAGSRHDLIAAHQELFGRLCNVPQVSLLDAQHSAPDQAATVVAADVTIYLPLADLIDLAAERERLNAELTNLEQQISRTAALLNNEGFVGKAKPDVVQRERDKLDLLTASRKAVQERLTKLK